jgi:Right handed beta helix region
MSPFNFFGPGITDKIRHIVVRRIFAGGNLATRADLDTRTAVLALIVVRPRTVSSSMKRAVGILIIFLTAWALLPNSNATNYYLSPSGADTNPGTQAQPWQTISKVNSTSFAPGDQILFQGGQSFTGPLRFTSSSTGTAANPIVVSSYGTGAATITSSGDGIDITDTQGFSISNLTVNGVNHTTNTGGGIVLINDLAGNVKLGPITIDSVTVGNFGYDGISIYGLNSASGWNSLTISNSTVFGNRDGIQSYAYADNAHQNILIDHVTTHDNPGRSGNSSPTGSGIVLGQTNGATIQRCVAYNNGASNTNTAGPVGIWCYNSNNILIQYCESYNNTGGSGLDGDGFDFDQYTSNSIMQNNYSHGNTGAGYLMGGAGSAVGGNLIADNISQNDGLKNGYGGIQVYGNVYNDQIDNNWIFSQAPGSSGIRTSGGAGITNLKVTNNIIVTTGAAPLVKADTTSGVTFSGNDYWKTDESFLLSWGGTQYTSLSAWKAATGQESGTGYTVSAPSLLAIPAPTPAQGPLPFTISSTDSSFDVNDVRGSIFQRSWVAYHYNALTVTTVRFATNPGPVNCTISFPVPHSVSGTNSCVVNSITAGTTPLQNWTLSNGLITITNLPISNQALVLVIQ